MISIQWCLGDILAVLNSTFLRDYLMKFKAKINSACHISGSVITPPSSHKDLYNYELLYHLIFPGTIIITKMLGLLCWCF